MLIENANYYKKSKLPYNLEWSLSDPIDYKDLYASGTNQ
jgi:hypothetical protein